MEKLIGFKLSERRFSMFIEFHPLGWGVGYYSFDSATAIVVGCITIGVEY